MQLGQERPYGPFSAVLCLVFLPSPFHKSLEKTADGRGWVGGRSGWMSWEFGLPQSRVRPGAVPRQQG